MIKKFSLVFLCLLVTPALAFDFQGIANQHIVPGYQRLSEATVSLASATKVYCENQNEAQLNKLQSAYRNAFNSWQSVQHIRFGPVQYLSREHRFEMWPDKRGSVGKHLARLVADNSVTQTDFDISDKSVAVQGFPALERLVFSNKNIDSLHCTLINAISNNLHSMAKSLLNDWTQGDTPFTQFFITVKQGNDIYESDTELAGQILNSLYTQLEFIATQKLDRPLGKDIGKARGKRSESWRSQGSLAAIRANLLATQKLYQLAFSVKLSKTLADKINKGYQQTLLDLDAIKMPLPQAVSDSAQREKVLQLRQQLSVLKALIGRDLAAELELSLGFNSLDGD